jgi:hypothetical protein
MARHSSIPLSLVECFDPSYDVSSEARDDYIRATYSLSKVSPDAWATFIEAFKAFTLYEYERSLSAPAGEVQINIGQNRRMRDLREDFIHIENLANKLKK